MALRNAWCVSVGFWGVGGGEVGSGWGGGGGVQEPVTCIFYLAKVFVITNVTLKNSVLETEIHYSSISD